MKNHSARGPLSAMTKPLNLSALGMAISMSFSSLAATYSVVELPTEELGVNVFAQTLDEQGNPGVVVQDHYNPPLDFSLINFDSQTLQDNLTDIDAARAGNPNFDDYNYLVALARSGSRENNVFVQQIALYQSYLIDGQVAQRVIGFDEERDETNGYTFGPDIYINDAISPSLYVGTSEGMFDKLNYTNADDTQITFVLPEFERRGFINLNGNIVELTPAEAALGGVSEANGVNSNRHVVGHQTIAISNQFQVLIDDCNDETVRGDQPLEACYRNIARNNALATTNFRQAVKWEVDSSGQIIDQESFAYPFDFVRDPNDSIERIYYSNARAINDSGTIVGESSFADSNGDIQRFLTAAIFADGQTTPFLNENGQTPSSAYDVNDSNMVTGFYSREVNGTVRTKFYLYDLDAQQATFPDDFFPGSASLGRDINNNNIIVGEGEVESANVQNRRRHGFIYYADTNEFIDLNDAIGCEAPYTIVSAQAINDDNVILANALVNRQARNVRGELVTDDDGQAVMVDKIIPVLLEPLADGEVIDCDAQDNIIPERKGASSSLWALLTLGLLAFRRRK
ncbi:DUF3466 family protein [Alteromonas sp. LMIT006]|uniref:DUF3466 family protein n=1 Tax=Alteromonadaceae TaxID=72275 RepID=UPI0020CA81C9|nr:DUF3466 family protein [Alteromonas sp. LMIT006]UTP72113.1 DUF3466 family protein [Alteromonas sp. LMIT006]